MKTIVTIGLLLVFTELITRFLMDCIGLHRLSESPFFRWEHWDMRLYVLVVIHLLWVFTVRFGLSLTVFDSSTYTLANGFLFLVLLIFTTLVTEGFRWIIKAG